MIICKHCGQPISDKSKICPFCGGNVKIPFYDKTWFHILLVLIIFTGIDYVIRNPDPEPTVYRTPIVESAEPRLRVRLIQAKRLMSRKPRNTHLNLFLR